MRLPRLSITIPSRIENLTHKIQSMPEIVEEHSYNPVLPEHSLSNLSPPKTSSFEINPELKDLTTIQKKTSQISIEDLHHEAEENSEKKSQCKNCVRYLSFPFTYLYNAVYNGLRTNPTDNKKIVNSLSIDLQKIHTNLSKAGMLQLNSTQASNLRDIFEQYPNDEKMQELGGRYEKRVKPKTRIIKFKEKEIAKKG